MKTKRDKKINWNIVGGIAALLIVFVYWIYCVIGIAFGPIRQKENGNYCRGYNYGIKVCWGDINAE